LYANVELFQGDSRTSPSGEYTLSMEKDGSLTVRTRDGRKVWKAPVTSGDGSFAVVQRRGNLVIYAGSGFVPGDKTLRATWATGHPPGARKAGGNCLAKLLDSGSLAILAGPADLDGSIVWASPPDSQ
jgi:hypothetical protein